MDREDEEKFKNALNNLFDLGYIQICPCGENDDEGCVAVFQYETEVFFDLFGRKIPSPEFCLSAPLLMLAEILSAEKPETEMSIGFGNPT